MKYYFILFINVFVSTLFGQDGINTNKGNLTFKYFKIEREQIRGTHQTQLNNDFQYLKLFKEGQRFAPDEPSSFSSLEYTFYDVKLKSKIFLKINKNVRTTVCH